MSDEEMSAEQTVAEPTMDKEEAKPVEKKQRVLDDEHDVVDIPTAMDLEEEVVDEASDTESASSEKSVDTKPERVVYIGAFKNDTSEEDVRKAVEKYADVEEVYVGNKKDTSFSFVTLKHKSGIEKLLEKGRIIINGEEAKIEKKRAKPSDLPGEKLKVFFTGTSINTTEEDVRKYFSKYGTPDVCVILRDDRLGGKSRQCGFVTFKDAKDVEELQASRPHNIKSFDIETFRSLPIELVVKEFGQRVPQSKLFIGGLTPEISQEELKNFLKTYGTVKQLSLKRNYAFAEFYDYDTVDKILQDRNSLYVGDHRIRVDITGRGDKKRARSRSYEDRYSRRSTDRRTHAFDYDRRGSDYKSARKDYSGDRDSFGYGSRSYESSPRSRYDRSKRDGSYGRSRRY